jgi:peptidoglycan-N-acetylglucosamine deacetylase
MKTLFILALSLLSLSAIARIEQYPEDRVYTDADHGLRPYNTLSIYKTGTFALTFDDGPHLTRTPKVLDTLKKHNVKAAFFVLTSNINKDTLPLIKRMLDEGHIVGSHGVTHDNSNDLDQKTFKARVTKSFRDLALAYQYAGHAMKDFFYRFPYGAYGTRKDYHQINALKDLSKELLGDNCINMVFWDIDSSDWVPGMTATEVASNIAVNNEGGTYIDFKQQGSTYIKVPYEIKNPPAGGVVLQHDVQETTAGGGLELFLQYAEKKNLNLPRLDEIEEFKNTKACQLSPLL